MSPRLARARSLSPEDWDEQPGREDKTPETIHTKYPGRTNNIGDAGGNDVASFDCKSVKQISLESGSLDAALTRSNLTAPPPRLKSSKAHFGSGRAHRSTKPRSGP